MFENLRRWFNGGTDAEKNEAGYEWARGELAAGTMTPQQILDRCESPFDGPHPFDKGAVRYIEENKLYPED